MQIIHETFKLILCFRIIMSQQRITFRNDIVLFSESCVKFPGIMIDEKVDWIYVSDHYDLWMIMYLLISTAS